METKRLTILVPLSLALLIGFITGVLIQRFYGVGNILREIGIGYPTRTPTSLASTSVMFDIPSAYRGKMFLFILAGQSNMVGLAPIPQNQSDNPRIYIFGNDYRWRAGAEPVDNASGQVDKISEDLSAGFGPSMAFASTVLSRRPDWVVGLIPCAKGSSGILEWQRDLSDGSLYGSCLKRARAATPMGTISGVLFFQGETDAADKDRYPQYNPMPSEWSALFSELVNNLREDLNEPALPVMFAQIGTTSYQDDFPNWELVKEQQRSTNLPMTEFIKTDDLASLDGLHFTADSYRIIGERFAAAYLEITE